MFIVENTNMDEERQCLKCEEFWPNDSEFFSSDQNLCCIACTKELTKLKLPYCTLIMKKDDLFKALALCREAHKRAIQKAVSEVVNGTSKIEPVGLMAAMNSPQKKGAHE